MQSVNTIAKRGRIYISWVLLILSGKLAAQDNSPLSRYGLGDVVPFTNINNRGMGHISAAYADNQTINFTNPAAYGQIRFTSLDLGLDINSRTLRNLAGDSYTSNNAIIPYLGVGVPLKNKKEKYIGALAFGLRPVTRVSYNIQSLANANSGDTLGVNYVGNGGTYQAFTGAGFSFGNLSLGFNFGYRFGSKEITTKVDMFSGNLLFTRGKYSSLTAFGGVFTEAGFQYRLPLNKTEGKISHFNIGAYANLLGRMNATRDEVYETVTLDGRGNEVRIDSVSVNNGIAGTIQFPRYYGVGVAYEKLGRLLIGADYVFYQWSGYRYYNQSDLLRDAWTLKLGAQLIPPSDPNNKSYWSNVAYRAGYIYGTEPYMMNGDMKTYAFTLGLGLPVRRWNVYSYQNSLINIAAEFGQRGNKESPLRESYFRFSAGFSLADIWFIKRKYD